MSRVEREGVLLAAQGCCSFPECPQDLADYYHDHGMAAKISHIVSSADGGPRADPTMPADRRNAFENLILLCDEHARAVDVMPVTTYTTERLRGMKAQHEERCAAFRVRPQIWNGLVGDPLYVNLNRLFMDALPDHYACGIVDTAVAPARNFIEMSPDEFAHYMHFIRESAHTIERFATPLTSRGQLSRENLGRKFILWRSFRTKNVYLRSGEPRPLTGDYAGDPQIYTTVENLKVVMPVDVRWATSTTGRGMLKAGLVEFVGIASLRIITPDIVVMSPILLGLPAIGAYQRHEAIWKAQA